jgi:GTP diphosphokinase / guanosine-3',5'-bis(diphosphate) 3'-diphosphatase
MWDMAVTEPASAPTRPLAEVDVETPRDVTIQDVLRSIEAYNPDVDRNLIVRAFVFAEQAHRTQRRKNGDPYIGHPVAVACIATELKLDEEAICAALLHDTVEDTDATFEELCEVFNRDIAELVDGVTKLSKIRFRSKEERQAENFRKMILAMSKDLRVILVKIADRTHNMRTLHHLPLAKAQGIARETMDIFAPLANRLGLGAFKTELEDLCFRYLHPEDYQSIKGKVNATLVERREYLERVIGELESLLGVEGIEADVQGRPKHFWSTYRKMVAQKIPFEKVHDLIAFRVIVGRQSDCYHVLGVIHDRWRPIPGRFKDYIALPKANKYQSLHTTVIGPQGQPVEIQIRTQAMHRIAEAGIAAHWKYKESSRKITAADEERFDWLKRLMEWQKELDDPSEFLESVKVELFAEEVYTFTPRGELKVLPRGSTPVDFAFSIHSEVGNTCSGAVVNGAIAPLDYVLRNGDVLEIITNRSQRPSKDWLRFVQTNRAKTRIRAFIKREQRARSLELGEQLLDKEFRRYSRSLARIRKSSEFKEAALKHNFEGVEELIVQVGSGKLTPQSVVISVLPPEVTGRQPKEAEAPSTNPLSRLIRRMTGGPTGIVVDGLDGVKHSIAKCCSPVPGESIMGFVTPSHVVSVHRKDCINTVDLAPERQVEVRWGEKGAGYPVTLRVVTESGVPGMLSHMSKAFGDLRVNIDTAKCAEASDGRADNLFTFHAQDLEQVNQLLKRLRSLKGVFSVERVRAL